MDSAVLRQHNGYSHSQQRGSRGHNDDLQHVGQHLGQYQSQVGSTDSIPRSHQSRGIPTLHPHYVVKSSSFFRVGTVFAVLWAEPAGNERSGATAASERTYFSTGQYNQRIYSNIRRMVVAREGRDCSWCFPVTTYGGQGVAKRGIDPRSHTALYIRGNYPEISRDEWGMTKMPLEVVPILPTDRLDKKSRLNFGKVHTVEHNLRVRPIGRFSQESLSLYRGIQLKPGMPRLDAALLPGALQYVVDFGVYELRDTDMSSSQYC